jgi:hypothetical protein
MGGFRLPTTIICVLAVSRSKSLRFPPGRDEDSPGRFCQPKKWSLGVNLWTLSGTQGARISRDQRFASCSNQILWPAIFKPLVLVFVFRSHLKITGSTARSRAAPFTLSGHFEAQAQLGRRVGDCRVTRRAIRVDRTEQDRARPSLPKG